MGQSANGAGSRRRLQKQLHLILAVLATLLLCAARTRAATSPSPEPEEGPATDAGGLQALAELARGAAAAARNLVVDAVGPGGAAAASPIPVAPLCRDGAVSVFQGTWEPPGDSGTDKAFVTVPRGPCTGALELPLVILHHGFMVPASWMQPYAELISGFGGFVVAAYDGANFVPDSIVAYDWLDPFVAWVLERERAGELDLPEGSSIDVAGGIGVIGHSRGGNIAAMQLNATAAAAVSVLGGYLINLGTLCY